MVAATRVLGVLLFGFCTFAVIAALLSAWYVDRLTLPKPSATATAAIRPTPAAAGVTPSPHGAAPIADEAHEGERGPAPAAVVVAPRAAASTGDAAAMSLPPWWPASAEPYWSTFWVEAMRMSPSTEPPPVIDPARAVPAGTSGWGYWLDYGTRANSGAAARLQEAVNSVGLPAILTRSRERRAAYRVRSPGLLAYDAALSAAQQANAAAEVEPLLRRDRPRPAAMRVARQGDAPRARYTVQFGAYATPEAARRVTLILLRAGIEAEVTPARLPRRRTAYRVHSPRIAERPEALRIAGRAESTLGTPALVKRTTAVD